MPKDFVRTNGSLGGDRLRGRVSRENLGRRQQRRMLLGTKSALGVGKAMQSWPHSGAVILG